MELKVEALTLPQPGPVGDPVDALGKSDVILPRCLSSVTLGDPATDHVFGAPISENGALSRRISEHNAAP